MISSAVRRVAISLGALVAGAIFSQPGSAFEYFEHRAIGRTAYKLAKAQANTARILQDLAEAERRLGIAAVGDSESRDASSVGAAFDYGDLTALAGDLSFDDGELERVAKQVSAGLDPKSSDRLSDDSIAGATRRQILHACNWILQRGLAASSIESLRSRECFDVLMPGASGAERIHPYASAGYSASRAERAAFERLPKFVELARYNGSHFPSSSWRQYRKYHELARERALCAYDKRKCPTREADQTGYLAKALLAEAMAQHFLHDSFASGHVGTEFGGCRFGFLCAPPKVLVQHTHDSLNRLGLDVYIANPPAYLGVPSERLQWTAFGDGSLFTPEAAFHRWVITQVSTRSIAEVLGVAVEGASECGMCVLDFFPLPQSLSPLDAENLRSKAKHDGNSNDLPSLTRFTRVGFGTRSTDSRVDDLVSEGWKFSSGFGSELNRSAKNANPFQNADRALLFRVDYVRPTTPSLIDQIGVEFWATPVGARFGVFGGVTWPRKTASLTTTARFGVVRRVDDYENGARLPGKSRGATEIHLVSLDLHMETYKPFAVLFHFDLLNYDLSDHRAILAGRARSRGAVGMRLDILGVQ